MAKPPPREKPRLSAAQLADYLAAAGPAAQRTILRQAKHPGQSKPLIIQYQHARRPIASALQNSFEQPRILAGAIVGLEQRRDDPANSPLVRDDAMRSIEVIQTFQRTVNSLDFGNAQFDAPINPAPPLSIAGVEISVWPDATTRIGSRSGERIGQLFVRCAMGGAGEAAASRRAEANAHLATIAHMHAADHLSHLGTVHAPSSMVLDVPREHVVRGSTSIARRVANIEAACEMIAAIWPQL